MTPSSSPTFLTWAAISLTATVLYGGAAPGFVAGVTQFNVQFGTPPSMGTNAFYLILSSNVVASTSVTQTVWITP